MGECLWLWLLIIIGVGMCIEGLQNCWDQERAALLDLKAHWCVPDSLVKSWTSSNCCDGWEGVTCGTHGRIISLDLLGCRYDQDPGPFNASVLLPLEQLQELHLHENQIDGFTGCHQLQNLRILYLSYNRLGTLPLCLVHIKSLQELHLRNNKFVGDISSSFRNLTNLQILDLAGNQIDGFTGCHQLQNLRILYLTSNRLGTLPLCLGHIKSLQELDLQNNKFVGDISSSFRNLTNLQTLDLSFNYFAGNIPSWMESWTALRELFLRGNKFKGKISLSAFNSLLSLEFLDLSDNDFQIPDSFKPFANLTKLTQFRGDSNRVFFDESEAEDAQPFMPTFQLQELSLSNCSLMKFPSFLQHQHHLSSIDLSSNSLSEDIPIWLLENNPLLDELYLSDNFLTGALNSTSSIHSSITSLDVSHNNIQHISADIGVVFSQLEGLDLSNNKVKGNVLSSICQIKSLQELGMSNNHLSGGLLHLTRGCVNLSYLDLSYNHFEGYLPSFYNLTRLSDLNLEGNGFSGRIPGKLFNLSYIDMLNLGNNFLEGPIPLYLCTQTGMLNLSHNKLSGSVSTCLYNLRANVVYLNNNFLSDNVSDTVNNASQPLQTSTKLLDLSYNVLRGHILSWMGSPSLQFLLLKGNKIQGHIPAQLCNMSSLEILDLSDNNLSGTIPPCHSQDHFVGDAFVVGLESLNFTTKSHSYRYNDEILRYMTGIDLSNNIKTGKIPPELGNLSGLRSLNLSHNKLWGSIPTTFSNLTEIESLDLSHNSLNGRIPPQLAQLNSLGDFNVAYNNLSGRIPFEAHLVTFDASSYQGNPFLCGPPLSKSCTQGDSPPVDTTTVDEKESEDDDGRIDMETFYVSFGASFLTMFLAAVVILWINPYWGRLLFFLAETCVTSSYYFIHDTIRKLRRVRSV